MMTGWLPEALETVPPNCSNPVPVSLLAVIRYCSPETEMLEAMAPSAVSPMSTPATMTAGTATMAKRRHLTRPWGDVRFSTRASYSWVNLLVKHFDATNSARSTNCPRKREFLALQRARDLEPALLQVGPLGLRLGKAGAELGQPRVVGRASGQLGV